jgi:hypothetical protein
VKKLHLVSEVKSDALPIAQPVAELQTSHARAGVLYDEMIAAWNPFVVAFRRWIIQAQPSRREVMAEIEGRFALMRQYALAAREGHGHGR